MAKAEAGARARAYTPLPAQHLQPPPHPSAATLTDLPAPGHTSSTTTVWHSVINNETLGSLEQDVANFLAKDVGKKETPSEVTPDTPSRTIFPNKPEPRADFNNDKD